MAKEEVKLFGTWISPFVARVKWAIAMKGVDYEYIEEDLSNKSELLLKYNPMHKKVPVLVHNGKPICESSVILEYIDEIWKENPILSEDPHERAMARFWSKFGDEKCLPMWKAFTTQGKEQEEAIVAATENLKILEKELSGKKFFGGEKIGLADISLGWIASLVGILEEATGLNMIEEERFPLLSAWIMNFLSEQAIKDCLPPRERILGMFRKMRRNSES